ncbi:MAG: response regulator, partial [Deltaproteobacteria bacterium]|nr:response regulator [Deltaproteobacteria bacterium]
FANNRLEEMLGYTRDELVGKHFTSFFDGENLEKVKAGYNTRKVGATEPYELEWRTKNGGTLATIMSPQPLFGDDGELLGSIAVVTDITALKRAEERDREHAEILAFLAETAMGFVELPPERDIYDFVVEKLDEAIGPAIIVACSFDAQASQFTVRAYRGLGEWVQALTELLGKEIAGMSVVVGTNVRRVLRSGRLVKLDGGIHELTNGAIPGLAAKAIEKLLGIRDIWTIGFMRSGLMLGTVSVITREAGARVDKALLEAFVRQAAVALDRRRAEAEKDELEEQLFQAQKLDAIGTLAGGVAHDFNNILTGILGQSFILKRNFKSGSALFESAEAIETMTLRAAELTRQLLGFARKGKKRDMPVDLHGVLDDVLVVLGHTFDKRITLTTRLTTEPAEISGDPTQLQQVVLNLAVNARDAMPDGGRLVIETGVVRTDEMPHERYITLEVSDDGQGIPDDVRSRIFEPFFTTKEQGQGTGMGLAVVYGIVQNHGGWIEVESEAGKGTKFTVALPALTAKGARPVIEPPPQMEAGSGRILVVDDEQIVREVVEQVLTTQGYEVVCRDNGKQAVEFYREHGAAIDLVILDLMMPVMNGTTCFRELRAIDPEVKVLLATGYALDEFGRQLVDDGLVGFVEKPFMPSQLAKAVVDALADAE